MVLTVIPSLQSHLVYLNLLSSLVTPDVYYPHRFGLSKDASQTFELPTRDGETIGGWKLQSYTRRADPERLLLFFHGNGGSRALKQRLEVYHELRQHGDVWTIDYRGFADSTGHPTEEGLLTDALTLYKHAADSHPGVPLVLVGQSLGSAVTLALLHHLEHSQTSLPQPAKAILYCPFQNLAEAASGSRMMPLLWPFTLHESLKRIPTMLLAESWPNDERISRVSTPLLLLHGKSDWIIPHQHSSHLFSLPRAGQNSTAPQIAFEGEEGLLQKDESGRRWLGLLEWAGHHSLHRFERTCTWVKDFLDA